MDNGIYFVGLNFIILRTMLKKITFIAIITVFFLSCKTRKVVVKDNTKPNTVEINYGDKTGQYKFKVLPNNVNVKSTVTFEGFGEAIMCSNMGTFEQYFNLQNPNQGPPVNFSNSRVLAIIGQPTEYKTSYTVKSTYQATEGYTIRIEEHQDPDKSTKMYPYILLDIPTTYNGTKFFVWIDQKQIVVK